MVVATRNADSPYSAAASTQMRPTTVVASPRRSGLLGDPVAKIGRALGHVDQVDPPQYLAAPARHHMEVVQAGSLFGEHRRAARQIG
jgi:hypothetical protein